MNTARLTQRDCSSPVLSRQVVWIAWSVNAVGVRDGTARLSVSVGSTNPFEAIR